MVEAPAAEAGCAIDRCRSVVEAREQCREPPQPALLLPLRGRESKGPERCLGQHAHAPAVARRRRHLQHVSTPHADNHGIWFNPDNPSAIQSNDGGANVTTDGGRTWSSILNQPTAELYMVAVDDQYPYLLYGPQQDNSTLVVASVPTVSFGFDHPAQAWTQASRLRNRRDLARRTAG